MSELQWSLVQALQCHEASDDGLLLLQARKQLAGFPKDKKKYEALLTDLLVQALVKLKQPAVIVKGREASLQLSLCGYAPVLASQSRSPCRTTDMLAGSSTVTSSTMQADKDIVKGIIEPARKKFLQQFGDEAPTVEFDSENFLPPAPGAFTCGAPAADHMHSARMHRSSCRRAGIRNIENMLRAGGDKDLESCSGGISVCSANGTIVCPNTFDARLDIAYQVSV